MAEMKTFNGYEIVDAKARQDIASHDTRITEVEKFFEAADTNGVIDKLAEVQKYIEDDAQAATDLIQSIADVDAKVDAIHIPEKVSELENDKGYLTQHQDISNKSDKGHTHKLNEITDYKAPDLTPYATKEYVDDADKQLGLDIDNIEFHIQNIIEPTITGKSEKGHKHTLSEITDYTAPVIPTKVSQLTNDSTYTTKEYVDAADKKIELDVTNLTYHITSVIEPSIVAKAAKVHQHTMSEIIDYSAPDLSGYARKTDIPDVSGFITAIPAEYITETELAGKGFLTSHQDISGKADKVHKHSMSDITDYEEPDLSKYALKTDIPTDYLKSIPAEYVTDVELGAKGYLTEHQDLSAYATKTYVNNAIANVEPNLTGYATKTYVTNVVEAAIDEIPAPDLSDYAKKADIPDVSDFITSIPAEYVTETELNNKGYLTEHQSLSNYYNKAETNAAIEEAIEGIEIPETDISGKADLVHQHSMADITDYVAPDLSEYAKKTDIPSLDGYATEQYVDDAIANLDIPEADVDLSNYYTKTEVDTKIEQAVIGDVDLSNYYTKNEVQSYVRQTHTEADIALADDLNVLETVLDGFLLPQTNVKQYVDNAIANVPGGGSGETGSGTQNVYIDDSLVETTYQAVPANLLEIFQQYFSGENRKYNFYFIPSATTERHIPAPRVTIIPSANLMTLSFDSWAYYEKTSSIDFVELDVRTVTINLSSGTWKSSQDKAHLIKESAFNALADRVSALEGNN